MTHEFHYDSDLIGGSLQVRESRIIADLHGIAEVWTMSLDERTKLSAEFESQIRHMAYLNNQSRYFTLRRDYMEACKEYNDIKDEVSFPR